MRMVLDAMGSDAAPGPEVAGAVEASRADDTDIILVGDESRVQAELAKYPACPNISVMHASESVAMDENPALAVRKKKDSSLLVALRQVKDGAADGFLSAGNTGAVMLGARVVLGPIPGVSRSAICQVLPTSNDPVVVLDLGANVNCTALHLCEFAEMGHVFSQRALGVEKPRVGLLNIGEEQVKGTELVKTVHRTLTDAAHINFIGNIEPKGMFSGKADVVVCDGFVGNVILKTSEAVAKLLKTLSERELKATTISKLGGLLSMGAFKRLKAITDPNEQRGAPLLGVKGIVIIVHGSCTARGIANAILGAREEYKLGVNDHIQKGIEALRATVSTMETDEGTP